MNWIDEKLQQADYNKLDKIREEVEREEKTMKTTIRTYFSRVSVKDVIHNSNNTVLASCKSNPPHRMDCERLVSLNGDYDKDLTTFVDRLKSVVYKDEELDISIIDDRDFSLPVHKSL